MIYKREIMRNDSLNQGEAGLALESVKGFG